MIARQVQRPLTRGGYGVRPFTAASWSNANASSQGYGDGRGDPKAEKPMDQGNQTEAHQNAEHPGPKSPVEGGNGGGSSSGPKDPSEASANSGGSRSKEAKETGSSPTGGKVGGGESTSGQDGGAPQPKISDKATPNEAKGDAKKQAEVEQHNKEFEKRHDRAPPAEEDKVDSKFWSGMFYGQVPALSQSSVQKYGS
jgi:hypothetical protein